MSRDDLPTLIICLACGGDYEKIDEKDGRYRMSRCKWCTYGGMDRGQQDAWMEHRRRSSGAVRLKLPPENEG